MSKKNDVSTLAENALNDSSPDVRDSIVQLTREALEKVQECKGEQILYASCMDSYFLAAGCITGSTRVSQKNYLKFPPDITEQVHALSLAEQIRRGQGEAKDIDESDKSKYYDFPDGKDDGRDGVGLYDLSEPADAYEQEQSFAPKFAQEVKNAQLQAEADKAQAKTVEEAKKRAEMTKLINEVSETQKSSENQSS